MNPLQCRVVLSRSCLLEAWRGWLGNRPLRLLSEWRSSTRCAVLVPSMPEHNSPFTGAMESVSKPGLINSSNTSVSGVCPSGVRLMYWQAAKIAYSNCSCAWFTTTLWSTFQGVHVDAYLLSLTWFMSNSGRVAEFQRLQTGRMPGTGVIDTLVLMAKNEGILGLYRYTQINTFRPVQPDWLLLITPVAFDPSIQT